MITDKLSAFLEDAEKESILRAISASDKIIASGIGRLLTVQNGNWLDAQPPAVLLFLKNSSERYYKISAIEPSADAEWEPVVQFEHIFSDTHFETEQLHANLLVFDDANKKEIGLNFYDSGECVEFHEKVCKRQTKSGVVSKPEEAETGENGSKKKKKKKKKKHGFLHGLFGHSSKEPTKKAAAMEIGEPTNFRHVTGVTPKKAADSMTEEQEALYLEVLSKLKTANREEEEMVRKIVMTNEADMRKSIMVKKRSQTPKDVKKKPSFWSRNSKAKIDELPEPVEVTPAVAQDPLNPDWSSPNPSANRNPSPTVTVSTSFKHSHTLAAEPVMKTSTEWAVPRRDAYGAADRQQPHNVYRFEEEEPEPDAPPELPSRSTSRQEQQSAPSRLPSHRESYRWATRPEVRRHQEVGQFAEVRLSPNPVRQAPPPPPAHSSAAPVAKPIAVTVTPSGPPPEAPPPPPPLPPIATSSTVPPAPPPPPPAPTVDNRVPVRLTAVPQITSDRRSLLDEIQSADRSKILRKVSDEPAVAVTTPTSGGNTMIDQIQNFLDARRAGINPSDSEGSDDDDDDDDDEWSD